MSKHKISLSMKQVLEFIVLGINNENYDAARHLAQDTIDHINSVEKIKEEKEESKDDS